jgi:hypothetical protein
MDEEYNIISVDKPDDSGGRLLDGISTITMYNKQVKLSINRYVLFFAHLTRKL